MIVIQEPITALVALEEMEGLADSYACIQVQLDEEEGAANSSLLSFREQITDDYCLWGQLLLGKECCEPEMYAVHRAEALRAFGLMELPADPGSRHRTNGSTKTEREEPLL